MTDIWERTQGRWPDILALAGVPPGFLRKNKMGPCPFCGGKDRYRFTDRWGKGMWVCNQCGADNGIGFLMKFKGLDWRGALEEVDKVIGKARIVPPPPREDADKALGRIKAQWDSGVSLLDGDNVRRYLLHRGIELDGVADIREIRQTPRGNMMTLIRSATGDGCQLQVTFLKDGRKVEVDGRARRYMRGAFPPGAAARIMRAGAYDHLGIAEGVETALSAAQLFDVPCWAAMDANHLRKWQPPEGVRKVYVFGDNDRNFVGQVAAYDLAHRLVRENKVTVDVLVPVNTGDDWNDVLRAANAVLLPAPDRGVTYGASPE